ncbi:MAG: DUF1616 domain-containing protein [Thermoplasmata archaeon]|nr:MAG: DUF1616 domain-containing protein [Thermoplasmata archaeon]
MGGSRINLSKKITTILQKTIGIDLALVLICATLLLIFALTLPDGNILRVLFGLPFLLFLPGYSLVSTLWVRKDELDGLERTALSLGLSIVIMPLAGLGLNYTPWGITLTSVVITLYALIIIMVGIAWLRRSKLNSEERFVLKMGFFFDPLKEMSSTDKLMAIIVGIVIIIGTGLLLYIGTHPPVEQYTELYILDENGATENYPTRLEVNEDASIIIGVVCHEHKNTTYSTVVRLVPESGMNRTLAKFNFSLDNEEKWQRPFDFNVSESGRFMLLIELFKEGNSSPYASNHLWIEVTD